MEGNYRTLRRVYKQLHIDISEISLEFINSLSSQEIKNMDDDISKRLGNKKIK